MNMAKPRRRRVIHLSEHRVPPHLCGEARRFRRLLGRGRGDEGQATPPDSRFISVSAGEFHTCGVRKDGSVVCWGDDQFGQASPAQGEFTSVSAGGGGGGGGGHTCGVKTDGSVACWGSQARWLTAPSGG